MGGYFCIIFIDFMLKGKISPNEYEKNDKKVLINVKMIKIYCLVYDKYGKLKNPKVLYVPKKKIRLSYCLQ